MGHSSDDDQDDALLDALNAHGQAFMQSFGALPSTSKKRKRSPSPAKSEGSDSSAAEEEWHGIDGSDDDSNADSDSDEESEAGASNRGASTAANGGPRVVVFGQPGGTTSSISIADKKAFMSSKVSKMRSDASTSQPSKSKEEEEEEKTNARNDILLHELIQNGLLSGSISDPNASKTPSAKRKSLEGRAMELAGIAKRGRGEKKLKTTERGKVPKRIREGMESKEAEVNAKKLEEAKNVGNYHPTIKKLFGDDNAAPQRKRERGLAMGVGKFVGGTLKLSARDVASVRGGGGGGRGGRGRERGGGRGGGRGRGKR